MSRFFYLAVVALFVVAVIGCKSSNSTGSGNMTTPTNQPR